LIFLSAEKRGEKSKGAESVLTRAKFRRISSIDPASRALGEREGAA